VVDGGFYMVGAESYWEDEGYTCWLPRHHSGISDSAETAEREAIGCVPWLKRQLGSAGGFDRSMIRRR
jgi:hypothetical protein